MHLQRVQSTTLNQDEAAVELCRVAMAQPLDDGTSSDAADDCATSTEAACAMLHAQWPQQSVDEYKSKFFSNDNKDSYRLPCSYLLLLSSHENTDRTCLGHGRLTECVEASGDCIAAATYIVIDSERRGQGLGTVLMTLLEQEAKRLGYQYVYLWTRTAVPFYQRLGYVECERVSLNRACLKTLKSDQVSHLEQMLNKKFDAASAKTKQKVASEALMLLPSSNDEEEGKDVWLRKRLVERVPSIDIPFESRLEEMRLAIDHGEATTSRKLNWEYSLTVVPWQRQVGPSCGLAALRMVRDAFLVGNESKDDMPSLLEEAKEKGYSSDGEVFDAEDLLRLAKFCGLASSKVQSFPSASEVVQVLLSGGVIFLPYDSQPGTRRPCLNHGRTAHWGIVVGVLLGFPANGDPSKDLTLYDGNQSVEEATEVWLVLQQSLSSKLIIASWSEYFNSNQQLVVIDPKFTASSLNLRDRCVCHGPTGC